MPAMHTVRTPHRLALLGRLSRTPAILLAMTACLAIIPAQAQAITLVRCKIDGKTVYSDTDCPRSTRLKNALPASKPIRISRKTRAVKHR